MDIGKLGVGAALAILALGGCASSSGQAKTRTASTSGQVQQEPATYVEDEKQGEKPRGGGADDRQAQEQAASVAPTAGAGTQDPHPLPTEQPRTGDVNGAGASGPVRATGTPAAANDTATSAGGTGSAAATADDLARRHQLLFGSSERYEVSGKLAAVNPDKGEITIQRDRLPPALLKVEDQTRIQVGGRQSSIAELKPGGDVRASFNLSGRRPIALEVTEQGQ
ncbi:MAG TPA: hypothetical protein VF904_20295 [Anaeromyxobacteraceae bacterium]